MTRTQASGDTSHIPGEDNVADDLSRGITVNELSGRWMKGPESPTGTVAKRNASAV